MRFTQGMDGLLGVAGIIVDGYEMIHSLIPMVFIDGYYWWLLYVIIMDYYSAPVWLLLWKPHYNGWPLVAIND